VNFNLNSEPVKYTLLALTAPVWLPFAKALWREINDALRDEGGLLGATPTAAELAQIERERGRFHSGMVSVTWEEQERLEARGGALGPGPDAGRGPQPPADTARTRGFRSR
jgi:hypothetical protein